MTFRTLILRAAGTNCDFEAEAALTRAGAEVERVHVNALARTPRLLDECQLLLIPGGFTFGDDVASGAVLSYTLEQRLRDALDRFIDSGRLVLGICNGFQVLVRMGFLPGGEIGRAALVRNLSSRFEDRWVRLKVGDAPGPWFEPGREYFVPVAHAEGRFEWFPRESGAAFPESRICVTYANEAGSTPAGYPANPNGSHRDIAGITNAAGNVMGLMPHPERFIEPTHHPFWTRFRRDGRPPREEDLPVPLGLDLFRRIVRSGGR